MQKLVIFLFLFIYPHIILAQPAFPSLYKVTLQFFEKYSDEVERPKELHFAKKKDGWHMQLIDKSITDKVLYDQLFWSVAGKKYESLKWPAAENPQYADNKAWNFIKAMGMFEAYGYERCLYFGYQGWDTDMINDFETGNRKNDTLLEGLARAHSTYATRTLANRSESKDAKSDTLQSPSDEQVKQTVLHFGKAIQAYRQLAKRNPDYETVSGRAGFKLFIESFNAYVQLLIRNHEKDALLFLDSCSLPHDDSTAACNVLNSVKPNGILFTFGDYDTYPLWYLQMKHVRSDIAVVNISMLASIPYVHFLETGKVVAFSTPFKEYAKENFLFGIFQPLKDTALYNQTLHDLVTAYQNNVLTINNRTVRAYPVKSVYIQAKRKLFGYTEDDTTFTDTIAFKLRSYLPMSELLMMDIIQENFNGRPFYFALQHPDYFSGYLQIKGITYQMVPEKSVSQLIINQRTVQQLETYVKDYYIPPFNAYKNYLVEYSFYLEHHLAIYLTLINYYLEEKDVTKVNYLVKQCFLPFGNKLPYVYHIIPMVSALYKSNHLELADQLAKVYIETTLAENANNSIIRIQNNFLSLGNLEELEKVMHTYNRDTREIMKVIAKFRAHEDALDPNRRR